MQRELPQPSLTREVSASSVKRGIYLSRQDVKARAEPDGSSSWVYSATARKLVFGRDAVELFKIQAGIKIPIKPQDLSIRASPLAVTFSHRGQDKVIVAQGLRLVVGECPGSVRNVRVTNRGESLVRVRVLALHDPTSLNYRRERDPPGEIGVNAFNRQDQVVMDDVGDTTGVRVVGFSRRPSIIYMTKDRNRAAEMLSLGELPESSLGLSGSVIILTQHDLDIPPGSTIEVATVSVYHPSSLEKALSAASFDASEEERYAGCEFASSSASLNFAFHWAKAGLYSIEGEANVAERLWCGLALGVLRGDYLERMVQSLKAAARRDGTLVYSDAAGPERHERPGPVETALLLISCCAYLCARARDKKLIKKWFPLVKKTGEGLASLLQGGLVQASTESPDGWRRRLGAGFPTGSTSEVNLLVVRALRDASTVAYLAGKGTESAKFREQSERVLNAINEKLRDPESGALSLNLDPRGVIHRETTIDQAVGLSYFTLDQNLSSAVVHRLTEKDFDTGYGPRTVPISNNLYYSPSYGEGQLGGYWTRAALSHSLLAFQNGYPSIGSAQLEKIARLVHLDAERLGGMPGEFPYWIDTERRQVAGLGSDPVACSRLIESVIFGECGLSIGAQGPRLKVPEASQLRWLSVSGLDVGASGSVFLARAPGRAYVCSTLEQEHVEKSTKGAVVTYSHYQECEKVTGPGGLDGLLFSDGNLLLLCIGNSTNAACSGTVPVRSKALASALFAQVEELQQDTGLWTKVDRVKLTNVLELKVELRPLAWKLLRISRLGA
jgi:hypothetical protein